MQNKQILHLCFVQAVWRLLWSAEWKRKNHVANTSFLGLRLHDDAMKLKKKKKIKKGKGVILACLPEGQLLANVFSSNDYGRFHWNKHASIIFRDK